MFNRLSLLLVVSLFSAACGPGLGTPTITLPASTGVSLTPRNGGWFFVTPVTVTVPSGAVESRFGAKLVELGNSGFLFPAQFSTESVLVPPLLELPLVAKPLPRAVIRLELEVSVVSWDGNVETTQASKKMEYLFDNR
jgi:hypothetical protein